MAVIALGLYLEASTQSAGQEAVRMSVAGEAAAEGRRKAALTADYYNLQLGPTKWNFVAGLDLEGNDNVRFDSSQREADLVLRPQVTAGMAWQVSDVNSLNLAFGAGYSAYVLHPELDRFFVGPGSELSLDLYAGGFWINLHERLSITENAYQDPTVVGVGNYSQLQNTAGLAGTWDLNKLVVRLGYDHANYALLAGDGGSPDGDSEVFAFSAGYRIAPEALAGVESGGGLLRYHGEDVAINRATDWNVGAFMDAQVMEHVRINARAGYTVYAPEVSDAHAPADEFTGIYARLALNHRVNRHVDYELSGGRSITFGFFSGTIDLYNALLGARWHLFRKLGLGTSFEFEHGSQVLAGHETFDRFGPGLSLDRSITRKLSGSIRYQYYQRQSDVPGGDYVINIVTLSLVYRL